MQSASIVMLRFLPWPPPFSLSFFAPMRVETRCKEETGLNFHLILYHLLDHENYHRCNLITFFTLCPLLSSSFHFAYSHRWEYSYIYIYEIGMSLVYPCTFPFLLFNLLGIYIYFFFSPFSSQLDRYLHHHSFSLSLSCLPTTQTFCSWLLCCSSSY